MVKITLIATVIALLAVLAYAATQPDSSTIIRSTTPSEVAMRLTMLKPFAADNEVVYSLKPQGTVMEVT